MNANLFIHHSIQYIESHLTQQATVEKAAATAGYSRYHFSRTFLAATGLTPNSYLRKRRLSEAARELVHSSKQILDIALDYQFGSQEAFTRSFRREFGVSPGAYRQRRRLHQLWGKITLGPSNLLYPGQGINPSPKLLVPEQRIREVILAAHPNGGRLSNTMGQSVLEEVGALNFSAIDDITIRPAHRQDISTLCQLYYQVDKFTELGALQRFHTLGDLECFEARSLSSSSRERIEMLDVAIWVAEIDGRVIGLTEVYLREDGQNFSEGRYGLIQSLVVSESMRGRGIGQQLLEAAEEWARRHEAIELRLETWACNEGPLALYTHPERFCPISASGDVIRNFSEKRYEPHGDRALPHTLVQTL